VLSTDRRLRGRGIDVELIDPRNVAWASRRMDLHDLILMSPSQRTKAEALASFNNVLEQRA
jgi:hypothetical protein